MVMDVNFHDVTKGNNMSKNSPIGQLSYTCLAISAAESLGEKRNSFVLPLTKMSFRLIWKTKQDLLLEKQENSDRPSVELTRANTQTT